MEQRDQGSHEWNERPIVKVDATVMVRSELGFTPHLGFGNSRVAIYEIVTNSGTQYLLYGYKIQDKKVTLDSFIPLRMPFTIASPIFHHWVIGEQRMGLSFNGTADARSFDRGIRVALENLEKAQLRRDRCSSTSEEPSSASPTSTHSFTMPTSDDSPSSEKRSNAVSQSHVLQQRSVTHRATVSTTLPSPRPQNVSTASFSQLPPPVQRCHSSSVPGRPRRISSRSAVSPPCRPSVNHSPPSTPESPLKGRNYDQESNKASLSADVDHRRPLPPPTSRRHRPEHRTDSSVNAHRLRSTKTPFLDNLERRRDKEPTKPNSYVQISSSETTRPAVGFPLNRIGFRPGDNMQMSTYSWTRFPSQRATGVGGSSLHEYRYHGLRPSDDSHGDLFIKPIYNHHTTSSFASFADPNCILKQPTLLKGTEYGTKKKKHKEDLGERSRCRNCRDMFNLDRNRPGSCPDAPPDNCEKCLKHTSCIPATRCVFYNCFRDSEGNYDHDPCTCSRHGGGSRLRRWLVLGVMSIFCPCLCLYPLMKGLHRCGVACHCCGGRHEAMSPSRDSTNKHP